MDSSVPLPTQRWIDRLFTRLQVRYGSSWSRLWAGIDPEAVKADWASVLGTLFDRNPHAIAYGLERLPDAPPTAPVFLRLCMQAPSVQQALPAPVASREMAAQVSAQIAAAAKANGRKASATAEAELFVDKMRAITERGGKLSAPQRDVLRSCERMLGIGAESEVAAP